MKNASAAGVVLRPAAGRANSPPHPANCASPPALRILGRKLILASLAGALSYAALTTAFACKASADEPAAAGGPVATPELRIPGQVAPPFPAMHQPPASSPTAESRGETADAGAFACLAAGSDVVHVAGRHETKYVTANAKSRAFDARAAEFLIGKERHGMISSHGDASQTGMCWAGGYVHSDKPWDASWDEHKDLDGPTRNSAVINNASHGMTVTGMHFFNIHDGPRSTNGLGWRVEHVWGEYVRDDCIENDHFSGGLVRDSLFDGCYTGISTRPSSAADGHGQVLTLERVLLRLQPMPYPYKWRTKGESIDERGNPYNGDGIPYGHGKAFKYEERDLALNNRFVLKDSVFAAGSAHGGGRKLNLPHPDLIERCEGVVLAWLADGRFRADASIVAVQRKFPDCITILEGQKARDFWREKVREWHRRHPDVGGDRKPANPGEVVFPVRF
jgi:hypothetical protein